ncbi:MAG: 2-oxoacid:acceptor oxidoreductase family protein, partial [Bacillota bacterium]
MDNAYKEAVATVKKTLVPITEHVVEIISDSGEGAQRCGQSFGAIAARMGYGVWTVEIIPAEIRPPARSVAGASGNRIRLGERRVTNGGDYTDLVVAFNEQVLLGRVRAGELKPGCTILLENMWRGNADAKIVESYTKAYAELLAAGYKVVEVPMQDECAKLVPDAQKGKNMFALGMLCNLYGLDMKTAREQVELTFGKKNRKVIDDNLRLLDAGAAWAEANLAFKYRSTAVRPSQPQVVINGNTALALGVLASG